MEQNNAAELSGETHRAIAVRLFNETWRLLETAGRTSDQVDEMIHCAHASRWHWGQVPDHGPKELSIGEWLISRTYAVLARPEGALWHAERCLAICEQHNLTGWLLAYAHEAIARANAAKGAVNLFAEHYEIAVKLSETVADPEDRELLISDLKAEPWFGLVNPQ